MPRWPATKTVLPLSSNGVLAIDKGTLYIQGEVSTHLTVASLRSSGSSGGDVYVENNVTYKTDPRTDPLCKAMLGVVAYGSCYIDTCSAHPNFTVDVTLFVVVSITEIVLSGVLDP